MWWHDGIIVTVIRRIADEIGRNQTCEWNGRMTIPPIVVLCPVFPLVLIRHNDRWFLSITSTPISVLDICYVTDWCTSRVIYSLGILGSCWEMIFFKSISNFNRSSVAPGSLSEESVDCLNRLAYVGLTWDGEWDAILLYRLPPLR